MSNLATGGTRILGIDPGLARMGYGIIETHGNQLIPIAYGCLETKAGLELPHRLGQLYTALVDILQTYQPQVMAVEELFFNRNTTTAFTVGQARGIALLAGNQYGTRYSEYTPMQVKQSVVGYGNADKKQVQYMVRLLLGLAEVPKPDDTADALAVAITEAHHAPSANWGKGVVPRNQPDSISPGSSKLPQPLRRKPL